MPPEYVRDTYRVSCDTCPFQVEVDVTGPDFEDTRDAARPWCNLNEYVIVAGLATDPDMERCPFKWCGGHVSVDMISEPEPPTP